LVRAAQQGAWISLDGVNEGSARHVTQLLLALRRAGLLGHALLSHDGDTYCAGAFRPYHYIMEQFLPALVTEGFTRAELDGLTIGNPARAFAVAVRAAG
jgi:predicted metal-dependent phosphotriesterase family hydrolase